LPLFELNDGRAGRHFRGLVGWRLLNWPLIVVGGVCLALAA
jgi:hypothetical protein